MSKFSWKKTKEHSYPAISTGEDLANRFFVSSQFEAFFHRGKVDVYPDIPKGKMFYIVKKIALPLTRDVGFLIIYNDQVGEIYPFHNARFTEVK